MSDVIQLLPDSVANQIAAGEVIQRPASVIKELVENAVDAHAKTINVVVADAGRTSIQVIDDGCGMSDTDARLSFERHATSKIRKADDLFSLHTMGFRGEALASIAAVAQVELKTRRHESELGTMLEISGSRFIGQETIACQAGSNFTIKNLFFNVPARRKFLKSNATELNNIIASFERIALVYPEISFTLHSNGTELFNLRATGLRQRIVDVFGKRINQDLLPIGVETSICKIYGFVGKAESAKKKGAHQYFFINGRYMKHPYFHKAVQNAFERIVPAGEQVPYFIYFDVDAENIDVNIHPTKTEIKFENEQAIWQILAAAVKDAVGKYHDVPTIDFEGGIMPDIPVYNQNSTKKVNSPKVDINPGFNPFDSHRQQRSSAVDNWEKLYENIKPTVETNAEQDIFEHHFENRQESLIEEKSPTHYQYKGQYIMTAVKSGLMIIDQHRAHIRILFEEYLRQMANHKARVQKILFPEIIKFERSEQPIVDLLLPKLADIGFEMSDLGGGSYAISGIPDGIEGVNISEVLNNMVATASEHDGNTGNQLAEPLALNLARYAAIPYGQVLNNEEMDNIVNRLFSCNNTNFTPDGQQTLTILPQVDIEKMLH